MNDKAQATRVGITLTGAQYRILCRELEYHRLTLKSLAESISGGPDRVQARERLVDWIELSAVILK